jgi:AcrR family transcriptional regulator
MIFGSSAIPASSSHLMVRQIREFDTSSERCRDRGSDPSPGTVGAVEQQAEAANAPDPVRAVDGRQPGVRGLATRARLLECTRELLRDRSYRELSAVDIAREGGTSPATFYQYFPDVESAVLVLGEQMAAERGTLSEIVRAADWTRPARAETASAQLAAAFVDFWARHREILRVIDLGSAEGDPRFRELRTTVLNDVTNALAAAVESAGAGAGGNSAEPMAVGAVLVSMLAHVAAHHDGLESWGIASSDTQSVMTEIIAQAVTGGRPRRRA